MLFNTLYVMVAIGGDLGIFLSLSCSLLPLWLSPSVPESIKANIIIKTVKKVWYNVVNKTFEYRMDNSLIDNCCKNALKVITEKHQDSRFPISS